MRKLEEPSNVVYGLFCACNSCRESRPGEIRYVGKTVDRPSVRLRGHIYKSRIGDARPVSAWFRKHGAANIRYVILDVIVGDGLYDVEQEWIRYLDTTTKPGLNLTDGGPGSTGMKFSEERRRNIGAGRLGKQVSTEALAELRDGLTNKRKLTTANLFEIKERLWDGESVSNTARAFGVSPTVISRINQDKQAVDIPWPENRPRVVHDKSYHQRMAFKKRREAGVKPNPKRAQKKAFSESPMLIRDIRRIRDLSRSTDLTHREIADLLPEYVTTVIVGKVIRGERWEWVE